MYCAAELNAEIWQLAEQTKHCRKLKETQLSKKVP